MREITSMKWPGLIILFGVPTILNVIACKVVIPYLDAQHLFPIEVTYFISVGLLVLIPMFFAALFLCAGEINSFRLKNIFIRMRIKPISIIDSIWTVGCFVLLSLISFIISKLILPLFSIDATPFFFNNMPLDQNHFWIIYIWPVFFFFNIFGEEFLWRGYIQPKQELLNKGYTWLVHGLFWTFWHLPMGLDLIYASLPIFFILPAVVQIRKNTTIAIVVHSIFGAFGFLALALGMIH